jgi:hypothetical protein
MAKVFCASIDCSHNENCKCTLKEVALKEWYIHTMHEGYKHMWECKNYEMSEEAEDMYAKIREVMGGSK